MRAGHGVGVCAVGSALDQSARTSSVASAARFTVRVRRTPIRDRVPGGRLPPAEHLGKGDRQHAVGRGDHSGRTVGGHAHGRQGPPGGRIERTQPEALGPVVGHIKISPVPAVACAETDRFPVAGLGAGARRRLRVGEAFGEPRAIAEVFPPLRGQRAQGRPHRLGGEVGRPALFIQHGKRRFCTMSFSRSTRWCALQPIQRSRSLSAYQSGPHTSKAATWSCTVTIGRR